ncbi:M48 family metallopeptidase [Xanthomonas albilineans]|uniref:Putative peptidase protein n=1 Tax=Xanthomonas albilineans (strain GPE PC73 / CFBP 7063) TaxID=380358 RepID=D2UF66_XANAP|nr:M48 family metallopeptidase [Xanthomonas albilineans]PPU92751.1 peptidase [Xanthomonas albilineans]QHQ26805.1 putative peptidase precursor protein [Xanthomonas albilineans]CBA14552.1 putative peptidase precursor protein [Xanthomonas albilineans GPE PC73]
MKQVVLGASIAMLLAACATTTSPTGRTQVVGGISQQQLDQMGVQAFAQAKAKETLDADPKHNAYVRCVVNTLVAQLPDHWRNTPWETALFNDKEANAFALPGGKVGVNNGIFAVAKNQDQLAAVLGHEIGHVISRHHEERITRQLGAQAGVSVIGALAGARYGQGAADTVNQFGGMTAQTLFLLPGSREQETEADVVGQRLMAQAGFDPAQAVDLWKNMMAAGSQHPPQWLSTHPDPSARISELQRDVPGLEPVYAQARSSGRTPQCG